MQQSNVKGHCQACGRVQVVLADTEHKGEMSKHGYKVTSGYFRGVCIGHNHLPLEVSREYLDWVVTDLRRFAVAQDRAAEELRSGLVVLEEVFKRNYWGGVEYEKQTDWRVPAKPVMVNWAEASEKERNLGLETAISQHESEASFARCHADSLVELAQRVHGQPLIDRDAEELQKRQERAAKSAPILGAFRTKAAQKDALERLSRQFERECYRAVQDRYLAIPGRSHGDEGEQLYYSLSSTLAHFRPKHAAAIRKLYPDLEGVVLEMERLAAERENVKAQKIIK